MGRLLALLLLTAGLGGCSSGLPPGADAGFAPDQAGDTSADPCVAQPSSEFVLGVMELDDPRRFVPFGPDCLTIELQSGLQGGFHVEPAVQAPADAAVPNLGGEMIWRIFDADGEQISAEARFEMFRTFWQSLDEGYVYWGDFVIFRTFPEEAIDTELTLELTLDFDDDSAFEDRTIESRVILRDEHVEHFN